MADSVPRLVTPFPDEAKLTSLDMTTGGSLVTASGSSLTVAIDSSDEKIAEIVIPGEYPTYEHLFDDKGEQILQMLKWYQQRQNIGPNDLEVAFDYRVLSQDGLKSSDRMMHFYGMDVVPTSTVPPRKLQVRRKAKM